MEVRDRGIRQNHVLVEHVVDRLAVDDGPRPTRIVGHHAADRSSAGGRQVRCESQSQRSKSGIELVEDDARLNTRPAFLGVDLEDSIQVLRGVEHQAGTDGLTRLRRPTTPRRNWGAVPGGNLDHLDDVLRGSRQNDAERLDLIDTRVGCVQNSRYSIESHLAVDRG